ncbi:MAG TPA: hypothetical protein V6D10_14795 [Trichocoleus sp.]|jgi:hypothetical protein
MRIWAACVVLFFGVAEAYQWVQGLTLPLPLVAVTGLLLAIVSNLDRDTGVLPAANSAATNSVTDATAISPESAVPVMPPNLRSESSPRPNSPQLPNLSPPAPPISFTIDKPTLLSAEPVHEPAQNSLD